MAPPMDRMQIGEEEPKSDASEEGGKETEEVGVSQECAAGQRCAKEVMEETRNRDVC